MGVVGELSLDMCVCVYTRKYICIYANVYYIIIHILQHRSEKVRCNHWLPVYQKLRHDEFMYCVNFSGCFETRWFFKIIKSDYDLTILYNSHQFRTSFNKWHGD